MRKQILTALLITSLAPSSWAASITAIMGNGIQPDNWSDTVSGNIQLALRAKYRGDAIFGANAWQVPIPVGNTYTFSSGTDGARGPFNYEFSINSDLTEQAGFGRKLGNYDYFLAVDRDPSAAILYNFINPLSYWVDNSYGTNATTMGNGVEPYDLASYNNYPWFYNVAQNSQNITFGGSTGYPGGALALVADATYNYELFAVASGAGANASRLASVGITVVVGNGGSSVPDTSATIALLGASFLGLAALRRRLAA